MISKLWGGHGPLPPPCGSATDPVALPLVPKRQQGLIAVNEAGKERGKERAIFFSSRGQTGVQAISLIDKKII